MALSRRLKRALRSALRRTRPWGFEVVRSFPDSGVRFAHSPPATPGERRNQVVSFSLYGDRKLYLKGALRALSGYSDLFPGWLVEFYVGDSVPIGTLEELSSYANCRLIRMAGYPEDSSAMFWRYLAAGNAHNDVILFRDADCIPTRRERAAVDEWLISGKGVHIMRDHPNHVEPIMGGLWGVRSGQLATIGELIDEYGPDNHFGGDQRFLRAMVYPRVISDALVHQDSQIFSDPPAAECRPFPIQRTRREFVGQGFTESGEVRSGHHLPPLR
jgi:hypothetical protein